MAGYRRLYGTARWRQVARLVVARAGGVCAACGGRASACDHYPIPAVELWEGGLLHLFFDVRNLRAVCVRCNSSAGARLANSRAPTRRARTMEDAARAWAARENAYWAAVEREALARRTGALGEREAEDRAPAPPAGRVPRIH